MAHHGRALHRRGDSRAASPARARAPRATRARCGPPSERAALPPCSVAPPPGTEASMAWRTASASSPWRRRWARTSTPAMPSPRRSSSGRPGRRSMTRAGAQRGGVGAGQRRARSRIALGGQRVLDGLLAQRAAGVGLRGEHAEDERAGQRGRRAHELERVDARVEPTRYRRGRLGQPEAGRPRVLPQVVEKPPAVDHAAGPGLALTPRGRPRPATTQ